MFADITEEGLEKDGVLVEIDDAEWTEREDMRAVAEGGDDSPLNSNVQVDKDVMFVRYVPRMKQPEEERPLDIDLTNPPSVLELTRALKYGFKSLPTIGAYIKKRNTPCVIENTKEYVNTWKLQHKWSNTSYLNKHLNPVLMVSMTKESSNLYGTDKMDSRMNTAEFFQRLHQMNSTNGVPHDGKHPYISIDINRDQIQEGSQRASSERTR
jgi:hypothetical protein